MPKAPFFLFDLEKATNLDGAEGDAKDFLAETFFRTFEQQRRERDAKKVSGAAALQKHGEQTNLLALLGKDQNAHEVMEYMKGLSPSGVELEIMTLSTFSFGAGEEMNSNIINFLNVLADTIALNKDADYTQSLINCVLKVHNDIIL